MNQKLVTPTKTIVAHDNVFSILKPINRHVVNKDSIEALTRETDKDVTGTFINVECPGQPGKICCKYYRGMQYFNRTFQDGEVATIPLSVARHINERVKNDKHEHLLDEQGKPVKTSKFFARYQFIVTNY